MTDDRIHELAERVRAVDRAMRTARSCMGLRVFSARRRGLMNLLLHEAEAASPGAERDRVNDLILTLEGRWAW